MRISDWSSDVCSSDLGPTEKDRTVVIAEGSTLTAAAREMEEDGAITSARAFLLRAKIFGSDAPIKAGEYRIPAHASNRDILNILQSGKVIARLVDRKSTRLNSSH